MTKYHKIIENARYLVVVGAALTIFLIYKKAEQPAMLMGAGTIFGALYLYRLRQLHNNIEKKRFGEKASK